MSGRIVQLTLIYMLHVLVAIYFFIFVYHTVERHCSVCVLGGAWVDVVVCNVSGSITQFLSFPRSMLQKISNIPWATLL